MRETRNGKATRRQGAAAWPRRILAGAAMVAFLGCGALSWTGFRDVAPVAGGLAEGVPASSGPASASARGVLPCAGFAFGLRAEHEPAAFRLRQDGLVVLAAAQPDQDQKLEDWREEGIRMAAELTGIPEAFFRWLQDKGVPVGEFMRFLMPFLEWLEMVEPQNGTGPSPRPAPQDKPRETAV